MEIIIVGRKRIHPDYDPERVLKELIGITKELYEKSYSYRRIALELDLSVSKVIKLLITGGVYDSDICRDINRLYNSGKTVTEIQKKLHVSQATVQAYLPYKKGVYNAKECSRNAERIREYRRKRAKISLCIMNGPLMHYKELNKIQKDQMKQIINNEYSMEWEDPDFMGCLLGELPQIRRYQHEEDISSEIIKLKKMLSGYNSFLSDRASFYEKIKKVVMAIQKKNSSWYGLDLYEVESCLRIHRFCLISGEGGIGKSYFLKCFEEQLDQNNIEHLCLYGKFEKNTTGIDVNEILKASDKGFIFIYDAINEMSEKGQRDLLEILKVLKNNPRIRIVLSYRTNTMDEDILKKYQKMAEYEYRFPGVSFESALEEVLKLSVPDVYLYEDILYSNNALFLGMLHEVLTSEKIVDETENGVAAVTYILEQYIKISVKKGLKNNSTCQGRDIWEDTKRVAGWMYKNEEKNIDEKSLLSVINTGNNYLQIILQIGLMNRYERDDSIFYHFVVDSLTDFLIARSLFEDISGKTYQEQVAIIKSKVDTLYSIKEAIIIAIFDNMSPEYERIKDILKDTGLIEELDFKTLVKVHFKQYDIMGFQELFEIVDHNDLLMQIGGFTDKPFNCSNYLFKYYSNGCKKIEELSNVLSGYHFLDGIKNRLKNILYFTTLNDRADRRDDEAFYFAILCCAAPNKDVRCLAMKLLYEVVSKNTAYIDKLLLEYNNIMDIYIQEAIIYVLSQLKHGNDKIIGFFNSIINSQDNVTAKSIRRMAAYFDNPYSFIKWNRKDLYIYNKNAMVSDYLNDILWYVDLKNKDYMPFRYWSKDHIDMHTRFLVDDKNSIKDVNDYLSSKYSCVCGGECSGLSAFEKIVQTEIAAMAKFEAMDINSFMEGFESVFRYVFNYYGNPGNKTFNTGEEDFKHSAYMKCVDIATGIYYGSLMCNHYTNQFATFNNIQNSIGYEVYDPLEYGEEVMITAPIPTYQVFIERLGDYVISAIEQTLPRDIHWVKDVELTRRNVLHLLEPIRIKKQEWVLLAGRISLLEVDKHDTKWKDTYDIWCCSSEKVTIKDDGNARNLTIELEDYLGELKEYQENSNTPWLCKRIKNITDQSSVLEETYLVLPPSDIIKFFNLKLNISDMSWENQDKEQIIICNNNKNSYYSDPIGGTVFIRKDFLDKFTQSHTIKYFAFTERYIHETGDAEETSLHFEIMDGRIVKEIKNDGAPYDGNLVSNPLCVNCPHIDIKSDVKGSQKYDIEWLNQLLKEYRGIDDEEELDED